MTNTRHRFLFFDQSASAVEAFSCHPRGSFDDFTVTHTKSPVIQAEDYYPFGLVASSYRRENSLEQNYLYQGKEIQSDLGLDTYDFHARMYDPVLGRTFQKDPHSENYYEWSPYSWSGNSPTIMIDPTGMDWFVSNSNGAMINIQGSSTFDYDKLREEYGEEVAGFIAKIGGGASADSWENFGADDMFDTEDNKLSESMGAMTLMTESDSEFFMNKQGYEKALDQTVEEWTDDQYEIEYGGKVNFSTGAKKITSSKVTYKRPHEFGVSNEVTTRSAIIGVNSTDKRYDQIIRYSERSTKGRSEVYFNGVSNDANPITKIVGMSRNQSVNWFKDFVVPLILGKLENKKK